MRIAALDIGGTTIKSGLWDGEQLTELKERATNAKEGGASVVQNAIDILKTYDQFDAIGISTAGQVDTTDGSIHYANQNIPGYTGTKLKALMEEQFQVPVAVENDVNAAALGELYYGAARHDTDFLCLTYGTGVGGAIVLDGKVVHGCSFAGGSFGGILTHPELHQDGKELSGCYEHHASTTALVRNAKKVDASLENGRKIFEVFYNPGDRLYAQVHEVVDAWIDEIVYGLITLIHVFNPPMILLGGGILAQNYVIEEIRTRTQSAIEPNFRQVKLLSAELGNRAGMMGAIGLVQQLR